MKENVNIASHIIRGLKKSLDDVYLFTGEDCQVSLPEYLFTVNIAKELSEVFNVFKGYEILIEAKTKSLIKLALPLNLVVSFFSTTKNKKIKRVTYGKEKIRNGRVDLAVVDTRPSNFNFIGSLRHIIEVKGINPANKKVKEDLERLLAFTQLKNEVGSSCIKSSFFATLYQFKDKKSFDRKNIATIYETTAEQIGLNPTKYTIHIEEAKVLEDIDYEHNELIGSVYSVALVFELRN